MKTTKILVFFFLLFASFTKAQTKFEREKRVDVEEVPRIAADFIAKISPKKVKWYQEESQDGTSFEAKFSYKKNKYSVEFTKNGDLIDVEKTIDFKNVNQNAQEKICNFFKENYQKVSIKKTQIQYKGLSDEVLKVFDANDRNLLKVRVFFEIVVKAKKDGETALYEILFDELGKHIKTLKFAKQNHLNLEF